MVVFALLFFFYRFYLTIRELFGLNQQSDEAEAGNELDAEASSTGATGENEQEETLLGRIGETVKETVMETVKLN